jgi:cell division inhibitor SepF
MVYLGLAEEDEGYIDDDYEVDEPVRETAASRPSRRVERQELREVREREVRVADPVAVAPARRSRPEGRDHHPVEPMRGNLATRLAEPVLHESEQSPSYQITTLQPRSYNEARQIGEAFRENIPVIMNLTDMSDDDAKRLVDFAAGLIFGLRGSIEKVTNKVFLLSPSTVAVSAEDKRRIVAGGFYNQS